MSFSNDNNKIKEVAEELRRYYNIGEPAYVPYEIGNKKSLLMINPALNEVFYIDKYGRPLLPSESTAIQAELPPGTRIVDISKLESTTNLYNRSGFHANQPTYTDSTWLDNAKAKIEIYSKAETKEKENVAERFQTTAAPQVGNFFTKTKTSLPDATVPKDNVLKDTTNKPRV